MSGDEHTGGDADDGDAWTATPLSVALDAQSELAESGASAIDKARIAPERLEQMQEIEVGQTPSDVVYTENKLELLHYESRTDEQHDVPILVIYALINKPYILDLQPDRSVVRRLLDAGHDVYMIDWNEPSQLDSHLTLDDYVNRYIDNCVDEVRERSGQDAINVLGYCMGGTMSAMYAALEPEKVRTLGLMAAGLCFAGTGGVLEQWGDEEYYDPRSVVETFGNVPAEMLEVGFALMDPVSNYVSKYVRLMENMENEEFVENFARMERWLSEGIDVAGQTYVEFLEDIYQDNKLYENELTLGGEHVDLANVDMPVLQIVGEYDHLIPPESSKPFNDVVGSDDVTTIEYPTGHIGLSVSGSSHEDVWPRVAEWYFEKSGVPDVDAVDGIGPTYAERLEAVGIETVEDLAVADPERVADVADVGQDRAADWIEQANDLTRSSGASSEAGATDERAGGSSDAGTDDVEAVEGIGPTYADRLRDGNVATVEDLADADAETIADIAGVGTGRAEQWIAQAQD